ncbi:hypothetical protein BJ138DRAFT_1143331 [Hygrophoropsis aurantiaca]|uniref:Uncharacterized protein n=1 Tax=Hygrophoropsis aurantiaca TaxID=72124 RepID=A0ACB8AN20_9AGAM|nr:hypothetical protein BJ138DRAFT_1143331 [Hygrophoropsis aurantiaca]
MLIGDAAHIHSPAGGQGMNLGLRDAIYLGEVITKHVKLSESQPSVVNDAILLDYATARHKRALEVIGFTKTLLKVGGASYSERLCGWLPISQGRMRDWFLWIAGKSSIFQGRMTWNLSGLGRR